MIELVLGAMKYSTRISSTYKPKIYICKLGGIYTR